MLNPHVQNQSVTIKVDVININLSPIGFHYYASQFLAAARSVERSSQFSPVPFYLYCRALELCFKAYLLVKGVPKNELKRRCLGHNLESVLARAEALGLTSIVQLNNVERQQLTKANAYYADKGFEYFFVMRAITGYRDLPDLAILDQLASKLVECLEATCLAA